MAEIILSAIIAIGGATQFIMYSGSRSQQAFFAVLVVGGLLIIIEAMRKYADL
jgi:hypothetical protein